MENNKIFSNTWICVCGTNNDKDSVFCENCGAQEPTPTPEKKGLTSRQKQFGAAILAGLIFIGGVAFGLSRNKKSTEISTTTSKTAEQAIPEAAKSWINDYGNRYTDPLSTYYAEQAYKTASGEYGSIMTDEYANSFEISDFTQFNEDELGFSRYSLPMSAEYNEETFMSIFNNYAVKEMGLYMNELARNPSQKAVAIMDSEFRNYCSNTVMSTLPAAFRSDDNDVNDLIDTMKSVVSKYGAVANYSVAKGEETPSDPNKTSFPGVLTSVDYVHYDDQRLASMQYSGVDIVIIVDVYDGKNSTRKVETIKDAQLSFTRQPVTGTTLSAATETYISIGQRKLH